MVPVGEALSKCPEDSAQDGERVGQVSRCSNVEGYDERISCDPQIFLECKIKFPPNCGAILGHREGIYHTCNHELFQSYTILITYSIYTTFLDFSKNTIVKIESNAFRSVENTQKLNLRKNYLTTLNADAFWDLINLQNLGI